MRLNPDCIRDILLFVEENVNNDVLLVRELNYKKYERIAKYSYDEFEYHTNQIGMSDFLSNFKNDISGGIMFHMLTPAGHEFIENVRSETNWNTTKTIAKRVGSTSISMLITIAADVIRETLLSYYKS